jgi:site-specific DNA-methyltransferase (adenine-specific)
MNEAYNMDCLEYMRRLPDKAFNLAVVDPPYGAGLTDGGGCKGWFTKYNMKAEDGLYAAEHRNLRGRFDRYNNTDARSQSVQAERADGGPARTGGTWAEKYGKKIIAWDVAPGKEYFDELFRVSRNQIIWGGNYFSLPPTRCFLIWRKLSISENFTMAMCEYAWTSFDENAKVFDYAPQGRPGDDRFHPTQKPIALYKWILSRYAKPGDKILDTHLGSGSSRIAAWDMGFDFVGCEIDKTYFDLQEKRYEDYTRQTRMF